jgi:hypothetical protein
MKISTIIILIIIYKIIKKIVAKKRYKATHVDKSVDISCPIYIARSKKQYYKYRKLIAAAEKDRMKKHNKTRDLFEKRTS